MAKEACKAPGQKNNYRGENGTDGQREYTVKQLIGRFYPYYRPYLR